VCRQESSRGEAEKRADEMYERSAYAEAFFIAFDTSSAHSIDFESFASFSATDSMSVPHW
jgi:hypothetical protein